LPLDDIDQKILKACLKDARLSSREIAKIVGVSVGTVLARTRKMETEGIIKGYSAVLDYSKLRYEFTVITEITVSKGKLLEIEKMISQVPEVCAVYDVTGAVDAIVIAKFKTREELSQFTKSLLKMPYVERTNTHLALSISKEDLRVPL
jgi:DNA-binding Lrp family transcriptional regulator